MTMLSHPLSRRQLLAGAGLLLPTLAGLPGTALGADYKALVGVFLFGGNDGGNSIVPIDSAGYNLYAQGRGALALGKSSLVARLPQKACSGSTT